MNFVLGIGKGCEKLGKGCGHSFMEVKMKDLRGVMRDLRVLVVTGINEDKHCY